MSILRKKSIFLFCLIASFMFLGRLSFSESTILEKTLSSDTVIKEMYQPGSGLPVGKILAVRGEAIVFHHDPAVGYRTRTGLPLYQGDIIRTGATGWILCRLMDGSRIGLMSQSTLAILQSNYNSARKTSASFLHLIQGIARFKLMPPSDLSSYEFKVQTQTAIAVTSKADFVVKANPQATEIIAFDKSRLQVTAGAAPEEVVLLSDFQRTVIGEKLASKTVESVSREDAETMMAEFYLTPRTDMFAAGPQGTHRDEINSKAPGERGTVDENAGTIKAE
jgi:FecR protein